jgi:hypothetical protein
MRRAFAVLFVLILSLFVVACGDDDGDSDESEAAVASFEFDGKQMTGPSSVEAGAVRVEFTNSGDDDASVTIVRVEGDHTAEEAVKAGQAWGDRGKPLPEWLTFEGGSGPVARGKPFSGVQELTEGKHLGLDIDSNEYVELDVTGDGGDAELPSTTATIDAVEYSFEASGLRAGKQSVLFANKGKEPHFALAAPIKPGKTIEDVKKSLQDESGPPPIIEDETVSTGILHGGREQVVELELRKGAYALVCFVPDRAGGPPHAFKGMVSEATVE